MRKTSVAAIFSHSNVSSHRLTPSRGTAATFRNETAPTSKLWCDALALRPKRAQSPLCRPHHT